EFDDKQNAISIEEKPDNPKSDFAITGLYIFDNQAVKFAKEINFSKRGELEITDINKKYLEKDQLKVQLLGRGFAWIDAGKNYVKNIKERKRFLIACIEEIVFYIGYISKSELYTKGKAMHKNEYGQYLIDIASRKHQKQYWDPLDNPPNLGVIEND